MLRFFTVDGRCFFIRRQSILAEIEEPDGHRDDRREIAHEGKGSECQHAHTQSPGDKRPVSNSEEAPAVRRVMLPADPRYAPLLDAHPALGLIGNTPLVRIDLFRDELPDVEVWAKVESFNPGGSLKDRPVFRMLAHVGGNIKRKAEAGPAVDLAIADARPGRAGRRPEQVVV